MLCAPLPENEKERLQWLDNLHILDTVEEQTYDDITQLAAHVCDTPIALVSLIDRQRQWFKSHYGLDARETPREVAFCAHAILSDDLFIVEDSGADKRFSDNPLATGEPYVKFYAGAPLILRDNIRIGTLCVIDNKPRKLTTRQKESLQALARQVVALFETRLYISELEQLDKAKDEFISMVNHELRTPLTSISGSLSLIQHQLKAELDASTTKMIDIAHRNSQRLLCIVNDILDIAKLESNTFELQRMPTDLIELVKAAVDLNMPYINKYNCQVEIDIDVNEKQLIANIDEKRIIQIMNNLLSNAAKFAKKNDVIIVKLCNKPGMAEISVTDHGAGISKADAEKVFKKFSQLGKHSQMLKGTGLGLNICKKLVEVHGGSIGFESEPCEYTTFRISIPVL